MSIELPAVTQSVILDCTAISRYEMCEWKCACLLGILLLLLIHKSIEAIWVVWEVWLSDHKTLHCMA